MFFPGKLSQHSCNTLAYRVHLKVTKKNKVLWITTLESYSHCLIFFLIDICDIVVENAVAPDGSNKRSSRYSRSLFQILVSLDTISDWPRWVSWQHFYSWGLPTKKLQETVLTSLKASHTFTIFFCFVNLQKNRCMRKELK